MTMYLTHEKNSLIAKKHLQFLKKFYHFQVETTSAFKLIRINLIQNFELSNYKSTKK